MRAYYQGYVRDMSEEETLPHERQAAEADELAAEFESRTEELGNRIDDAREDWEAKKADAAVPGAPPDPDDDVVEDDAPEADYPTKGPSD